MQRRMRTELDLDRHMAETSQAPQAALVGRRRQRMVGNDGYHRRAMAGTDLPQMQVGDPVAPGLQPVADHGFEVLVDADIEQHGAGIADQPERPTGDDEAADDPDRRIGPDPVRIHRDHQRCDRENRRRGVGEYVDVGGAKVVVMVTMAMGTVVRTAKGTARGTVMGTAMRMTVAMMIVIVAIAQQPRADEVDAEAQSRDRYRLAIRNRYRMNQPDHDFIENLNRDQAQNNRAGKGGKVAELAGAEGET